MASFGRDLNETAAIYDVLGNTSDILTAAVVGRGNVTFRAASNDHLSLFRFIAHVPVSIPIIILGIIANAVTFVVLCHQKPKLTTTLLLQGLAVIDILVLVASLFRNVLTVHTYTKNLHSYVAAYPYIFMCTYPFIYFIRLTDNWLTTLLTIDRYIAVCRPLDAQRICTPKRTYKNMAVVVVLAAAFSVPRFFEYELSARGFIQTSLNRNKIYTIVYRIVLFSIFMYVIPVVSMTVLNFRLLWQLRKANEFRSLMRQASQHSDASVPATKRSVTIIVLVVVLVCVVCNATAFVSHLVWSLHVCFRQMRHLASKRPYLANISNVLVCLNSAVNFFIYCLCSRNFRQELVRVFRCRDSCCCCGSCGSGCCDRCHRPLRHRQRRKSSTSTCSCHLDTTITLVPLGGRNWGSRHSTNSSRSVCSKANYSPKHAHIVQRA
ncbi:FMRFamide receptor [Lamellibrachia satsuma]|nr:FMRFamide receptor [Lamellibrachia satsuma]